MRDRRVHMDPGTALIIAGVIATTLIAEMRLLRRDIRDRTSAVIAASIERSRRRDRRELRAQSAPPRRRELAAARDDDFAGEESTDIHDLIEQELEHQRARRKTGRHPHPGERPPRRGTHHD